MLFMSVSLAHLLSPLSFVGRSVLLLSRALTGALRSIPFCSTIHQPYARSNLTESIINLFRQVIEPVVCSTQELLQVKSTPQPVSKLSPFSSTITRLGSSVNFTSLPFRRPSLEQS